MNTKTFEYFGYGRACDVAAHLLNLGAPFEFEPCPCDVYEFTVKDEYASRMPKENVGRGALARTSEGHVVCGHCGREYESDVDGAYEGDPCPSGDCPSHGD